jgi:hypothetical protein
MLKNFKQAILPILLAAVWISISEFVRNEFLVKSFWIKHYESLGLVFTSAPCNGAVWGLWSLFFAITIYIFAQRFTLIETTLLAWFSSFVMMWVVLGNLSVLPFGLLPLAIPLSMLESFVASWLVKKYQKGR